MGCSDLLVDYIVPLAWGIPLKTVLK